MSFAAEKSARVLHPKVAKLVPFLRKLQQLCESAPTHVARWSADGKQFDVLDPKGFDDLLKVHFEGASPATFHRQLFFYGWVKLNHTNGGGDEKTKGTWSFRHPCFLRDEPHKIYEIKRYARASDREEEDGSRVDVLERRVSALQSLVDDLSRKLAAVQLTLDKAPLPVGSTSPVHDIKVAGRKRVKDDDEEEDIDLLEDLRLSENDLVHLFDDLDDVTMADEDSPPSPMVRAHMPAEAEQAPLPLKQKIIKGGEASQQQQKEQSVSDMKQHAQSLINTLMSSAITGGQFQAAVVNKTMQEGSASQSVRKVEVPPHLSVC